MAYKSQMKKMKFSRETSSFSTCKNVECWGRKQVVTIFLHLLRVKSDKLHAGLKAVLKTYHGAKWFHQLWIICYFYLLSCWENSFIVVLGQAMETVCSISSFIFLYLPSNCWQLNRRVMILKWRTIHYFNKFFWRLYKSYSDSFSGNEIPLIWKDENLNGN